jgi:hypothetical protein
LDKPAANGITKQYESDYNTIVPAPHNESDKPAANGIAKQYESDDNTIVPAPHDESDKPAANGIAKQYESDDNTIVPAPHDESNYQDKVWKHQLRKAAPLISICHVIGPERRPIRN